MLPEIDSTVLVLSAAVALLWVAGMFANLKR
ncbi:MAG: hypothetical protein RIR15_84, partial [Actinomycetota bacterium]